MTTAPAPPGPDAVLVDLLTTPEGRADPYSRYADLLRRAPVFRSALDMWVVSRYDDCQQVLRDQRLGKDEDRRGQRLGLSEEELAAYPAFQEGRRSMLFLNPPDHTRIRGLVSKAFTPRTVEALRPHIVRLTDELLDRFDGDVDVMDALAFPLPVTVIGEMLGVPVADRPPFRHLVRAATATLEVTMTTEQLAAANDAAMEMAAYFRDLIPRRRADPGDDLLSHLIAAEDEGDKLSEEEVIATVILLFGAGFETTTNLIGNGLFALLRHPDQLDRLRTDPALLRPGVEELLRFDSPVQLDGRTAFEPVEIDGHTVAPGETVLTLLGAANRDPDHFTDPDRLDVGRDEGPPLSFGSGIHYCLGAALARVEGQVVLARLLERFPTIELLDERPPRREGLTLRGLAELPVRFA